MNRLESFYEVTEILAGLLEQDITPKNREAVIWEANRLIKQRANMLYELHPPFTDEEKQIGAQIVSKNRVIQTRMHLLFTDLKQEMKQIQQKKKSNQTYMNPYGHVRPLDGMFLDSKK